MKLLRGVIRSRSVDDSEAKERLEAEPNFYYLIPDFEEEKIYSFFSLGREIRESADSPLFLVCAALPFCSFSRYEIAGI